MVTLASQICAVAIFVAMFGLIISEKIPRHIVTLGAGALTLIVVFGICMHSFDAILETLNFKSFATLDFWYQAGEGEGSSSGINWATIIFIGGMMVMVEGMARVGFFRWLCMLLAKTVKYKVIPIYCVYGTVGSTFNVY